MIYFSDYSYIIQSVEENLFMNQNYAVVKLTHVSIFFRYNGCIYG